MNILFIDFDKFYLTRDIPQGYHVLASDYEKKGVISIPTYVKCRSSIMNEFDKIFNENTGLEKIFEVNKVILFLNFFYPLGQWLSAIDEFFGQEIENRQIKIVFSSFSNNPNVFLFEAEGEINKQFLYHKSFFLSYYIKNYLERDGFNAIKIIHDRTLQSRTFYFLRGLSVINFKLLQLLFYKIFVLKRDHIDKSDAPSEKVILSSRGVTHTQFMQGILGSIPKTTIAFINEGSARPYRNLNYCKKNKLKFFYCEGFLSFSQIFGSYLSSLKLYFRRQSKVINFMGMKIDLNRLIAELGIFEFNMRSYAISVSNAKKRLECSLELSKLMSFELLFPFSYYAKEQLKIKTIQIQTVAIFKERYPDFVFGDELWFSNSDDCEFHAENNLEGEKKYEILENLKYLGLEKSVKKTQFKKFVYFSQPIFLCDEKKLLIYLKEFCSMNNLN